LEEKKQEDVEMTVSEEKLMVPVQAEKPIQVG
jgi:hypothetical protein